MSQLQFSHTRQVVTQIYISQKTCTITKFFECNDFVKKPLVPCYNSLYIVCDSADKYFTILPNDKIGSISIDRIKPPYIDTKDMTISQLTFSGDITSRTSQTQQVTVKIIPQNIAPCSTKSRRRVSWPKHFKNYVPLN